MKLTANRAALAAALASCARIVSRKSTIPIMQHIVVDADAEGLRLTASDMTMDVTFRVPADVTEMGSLAVLGDYLADIVDRAAPSIADISLRTLPNGRIEFRSGTSRHQIPTMDPNDLPTNSADDFADAFTLAGDDIVEMMTPCLMAVSTEETRQFLCGVYMHGVGGPGVDAADDAPRQIAFAASTGNIFMIARHGIDDDAPRFAPFTVPTKAAAEVLRLAKGPVAVQSSARLARFTFDMGGVLTTKLLEGAFPNYLSFTPGTANGTTVDSKLLTAAIGRAALGDSDSKDPHRHHTRLDIRDGVLVIDRDASARASVYEEVPCVTGTPTMFAVMHPHIATGLRAIGGDQVSIVAHEKVSSGATPVAIRRTGSDDAVFIIGPVLLRSTEPAKAEG